MQTSNINQVVIATLKGIYLSKALTFMIFFLYKQKCCWSVFAFQKVTQRSSSNRSLFKLIISDKTLIKLKCFFALYVPFNGQTCSSVFEQFTFTAKFFGLQMQKSTFF